MLTNELCAEGFEVKLLGQMLGVSWTVSKINEWIWKQPGYLTLLLAS